MNSCLNLRIGSIAKQNIQRLLKKLKDNVGGHRAFSASGYALKSDLP